jgi:hypothetical protein
LVLCALGFAGAGEPAADNVAKGNGRWTRIDARRLSCTIGGQRSNCKEGVRGKRLEGGGIEVSDLDGLFVIVAARSIESQDGGEDTFQPHSTLPPCLLPHPGGQKSSKLDSPAPFDGSLRS